MTSLGSVDGLVSGINTTQIVDQLIAIEARPQTLAKQRLDKFNSQSTAYADLRTKFNSLNTAALAVSSAFDWQAISATSSDPDTVTATGSTASGTGNLSFVVNSLASPDVYASGWTVASLTSTVVPAPGAGGARTITVGVGSDSRSIDVGDGSLESVVNAINGQSNFKLSASAVKVSEDNYRLQLTATEAGASNTISFNPANFSGVGSWLHVSTATSSQITVGSGADSYTVTSNTNTMADVLPGVTLSLKRQSPVGTTVTVATAKDPSVIANKIDAMVTAFNIVANNIADLSKYDAATKKAGVLIDSSALRQARQLMSTAVSGSGGSESAVMAGITLNRDGTIAFDRAKFVDQFAKDPTGTQALFTDGAVKGLGKRVYDVAQRVVDLDSGLLTSSENSLKSTTAQLQLSIDSMQTRLDRHKEFLRSQFNAMETALGTMKNQSSWLSGQLTSLSTA
jgi:flagellar hook-associated protein 2